MVGRINSLATLRLHDRHCGPHLLRAARLHVTPEGDTAAPRHVCLGDVSGLALPGYAMGTKRTAARVLQPTNADRLRHWHGSRLRARYSRAPENPADRVRLWCVLHWLSRLQQGAQWRRASRGHRDGRRARFQRLRGHDRGHLSDSLLHGVIRESRAKGHCSFGDAVHPERAGPHQQPRRVLGSCGRQQLPNLDHHAKP